MRSGNSATFKALLTRFAHDTSGAIALVWALASIVVVGMVGAAIDYSRTVNVKEEMAMELDGAVLAGARFLASSTDIDASKQHVVDTFIQTAELAIGDAATYELAPNDVVIDQVNSKITATATGKVKTVFMGVLGIDTTSFSVEAQASFPGGYAEVALVIDVTGSMDKPDGSGSTRILALKKAARDFINTLMPEETSDRVRISIVPYSEGVRLSESMAKTVTNDYSTRCATERTGAQQYTDASYTAEAIGNGSRYRLNRYNEFDEYWQLRDVPDLYQSFGRSWGACPNDELLPLTNNRDTLLAKIDSLSAINGTAGQTGISWGWYTLSPNWSDFWPTNSEAKGYDDEKTKKAIVIMTDGVFNAIFDKATLPQTTCTGFDPFKKCHTTSSEYWYEIYDENSSASADRAKKVCTAIKARPPTKGQASRSIRSISTRLRAPRGRPR